MRQGGKSCSLDYYHEKRLTLVPFCGKNSYPKLIPNPISNPGCVVQLTKKYILPCFIITILLVTLVILPSMAVAADTNWTAGVRGGGSWLDAQENFRQNEAFVSYKLPWKFRLFSGVSLTTHVEATAGALTRRNTTGFVGSFGPEIALNFFNDRLWVRGGSSATGLSENVFDGHDLGGPFQFTTHVGFGFRIIDHLGIGYRFQHMSNACIYDKNPGLNLHMLEARWEF